MIHGTTENEMKHKEKLEGQFRFHRMFNWCHMTVLIFWTHA